MPIDTTKVQGRRTLKFATLDDVLADLDTFSQSPPRAIGNWTPGQILKHLTVPMIWCLDGAPIRAPWYVRTIGWFMKTRFIANPMPVGFKLSADFARHLEPAEAVSWEEGMQAIRTAIARMKAEPQRHPSPFLGELTPEQWVMLHCRHAELHLSFLVVETDSPVS